MCCRGGIGGRGQLSMNSATVRAGLWRNPWVPTSHVAEETEDGQSTKASSGGRWIRRCSGVDELREEPQLPCLPWQQCSGRPDSAAMGLGSGTPSAQGRERVVARKEMGGDRAGFGFGFSFLALLSNTHPRLVASEAAV